MATPTLRFLTPLQIQVLAQIYRGDPWKQLERYIARTIRSNASLVGVGPITLDVTKWRKINGLIKKAIKALDEFGWDVTEKKDKKHHYLLVTEKVPLVQSFHANVTRVQATPPAPPSNVLARRSRRR